MDRGAWRATVDYSPWGRKESDTTEWLKLLCGTQPLRCPAACGILVPLPGFELESPTLEGRLFITGPPGKSLNKFLLALCFPPGLQGTLDSVLFLCISSPCIFSITSPPLPPSQFPANQRFLIPLSTGPNLEKIFRGLSIRLSSPLSLQSDSRWQFLGHPNASWTADSQDRVPSSTGRPDPRPSPETFLLFSKWENFF